jgi:kynureninase
MPFNSTPLSIPTHAELSEAYFVECDKQDSLASFRGQFELADGLIYLNGNSLGVLPTAAKTRMQEVISTEWGTGLIRSWNAHSWINLPQRIGGKLAKIVGAKEHEVIVCDSTSINLFKLAAAAIKLNPGRTKIVTEPGNFPTDLYILNGVKNFIGQQIEIVTVPSHEITQHIDSDTALVCLTHVHYKSGTMLDMAAITKAAHDQGALMMWDLSHSTGAVPVDLNKAHADLAVGCGYKYLNGGPGAPAFLYVAEQHIEKLQQPLTGWFGHANAFAMSDDYEAASGIEKTLCGTTPVIAASALEVGVDIMCQVDFAQLREKSLSLSEHFIKLMEPLCEKYGFELATPLEPSQRGSQVSYKHSEGYAIMQALIHQNIIGDFRAPEILRFGFAPLYVQFIDLWNTVQALDTIMRNETWNRPEFKTRSKVT